MHRYHADPAATLLDTVRTAGYGRQAAVCVVDFAIDSLARMAAELPGPRTQQAKSQPPSEAQLEMRKLLALARFDYPRIRDAAVQLTAPEAAAIYAKLGLDILIGGIESSAAERRRRPARRS